jgi:hypothetical protein
MRICVYERSYLILHFQNPKKNLDIEEVAGIHEIFQAKDSKRI